MSKTGKPYTPKNTVVAESRIRNAVWDEVKETYEGPVFVDIRVQMVRAKSSKNEWPVVKPDLDNVVKLVTDAMNGLVYRDDCQICSLTAEKVYGKVDQISITVGEIA